MFYYVILTWLAMSNWVFLVYEMSVRTALLLLWNKGCKITIMSTVCIAKFLGHVLFFHSSNLAHIIWNNRTAQLYVYDNSQFNKNTNGQEQKKLTYGQERNNCCIKNVFSGYKRSKHLFEPTVYNIFVISKPIKTIKVNVYTVCRPEPKIQYCCFE